MTSDLYDDAYDAGARAALKKLAPLADAIHDTILMFEDIANARQLPPTAQAVQQYVAMGKQLRRLLDLSGLKGS
jgi:hypothetical protein